VETFAMNVGLDGDWRCKRFVDEDADGKGIIPSTMSTSEDTSVECSEYGFHAIFHCGFGD
jgi:hypothetical protein